MSIISKERSKLADLKPAWGSVQVLHHAQFRSGQPSEAGDVLVISKTLRTPNDSIHLQVTGLAHLEYSINTEFPLGQAFSLIPTLSHLTHQSQGRTRGTCSAPQTADQAANGGGQRNDHLKGRLTDMNRRI
jgi:hypothetical protein